MVNLPPMPKRIAALPRNKAGYPIPWFVNIVDGVADFRVIRPGGLSLALHQELCWVCGDKLGRRLAFVIGPMSVINRISNEPASHRECAEWAAQACPFLSVPNMRRQEHNLPAHLVEPGGLHDLDNPGGAAVWVTRDYQLIEPRFGDPGILIELGPAEEVLWYHAGRRASRDEAAQLLAGGVVKLRDMADDQASMTELLTMIAAAQQLLPAAQAA